MYKETVRSDEQSDELIDRNSAHPLGMWIKLVKEAQAKLTWDIAEKAGIKKVVDYFSRHWMGQTRQMMLYEIPAKDRDLLEDGIIPDDARKPDSGKPF